MFILMQASGDLEMERYLKWFVPLLSLSTYVIVDTEGPAVYF